MLMEATTPATRDGPESPRESTLLEKAIVLAIRAHAGQLDKTGEPYILHPLRLMLLMETEEEMITAVLHDVIEDAEVTFDDLRSFHLPETIISALELLTHDTAGTSYVDYIAAIKMNPLASRIKLADLAHNMDVRRLPLPLSARDWGRLEKYRRAWEILSS
jgi:(p)ppGpp synthase/HD superfamily hydrolase